MGIELTQKANLSGKVISPLTIDKTLTKEYMCADAKATGDAINKVREDNKAKFFFDASLGANISAQGCCHYIEGSGFVMGHLFVKTDADITSEQNIATLTSLNNDMVKTTNITYLTADGIAYPLDFEGKVIKSRSTIPNGKIIQIDFCIGLV